MINYNKIVGILLLAVVVSGVCLSIGFAQATTATNALIYKISSSATNSTTKIVTTSRVAITMMTLGFPAYAVNLVVSNKSLLLSLMNLNRQEIAAIGIVGVILAICLYMLKKEL